MPFLFYIYLTLFCGNSIASFLGMPISQDSFILALHYRSLPFLLFCYIFANFPKFNRQEILLITISMITLMIASLKERSAMFAVSVNNAIEPVILIALLRYYKDKYRNVVKSALLLFFIIECGIAWIEFVFKTFLFADPTSIMDENRVAYMLDSEMRAFSLHGHPLQNAFVVSILSFFFLSAKAKPMYRYGLFTIGYITLFAFNTRSSIYLMSAVFTLVLIRDLKKGYIRRSNKLVIVLLVLAIGLLGYLIQEYHFGSRLVYGISEKDASSNTRFMLVDIILRLPLSDFLWGMNHGISTITTKYDFFAIENSLANFIVCNGAVYTFLWCVLFYKCLETISKRKTRYLQSFIIFFTLINVNNSLMTDTPIAIIYILALYALDNIGMPYSKKNNSWKTCKKSP